MLRCGNVSNKTEPHPLSSPQSTPIKVTLCRVLTKWWDNGWTRVGTLRGLSPSSSALLLLLKAKLHLVLQWDRKVVLIRVKPSNKPSNSNKPSKTQSQHYLLTTCNILTEQHICLKAVTGHHASLNTNPCLVTVTDCASKHYISTCSLHGSVNWHQMISGSS